MNAEMGLAPDTVATQEIARICKAAGDSLRIDILSALATDSYGVLELSHAFQVKQSGMSHHLKVLAKAGLVVSRREGNSIFYRRSQLAVDDSYRALKVSLFAALGPQLLSIDVQERLAQVHAERALTSQQFFLENADKFREQQDLIASFPVYAQQVSELLQQTPVPGKDRVLEIGPGEGEFLPELAATYRQVLGLDSSAAMLARAAETCSGYANVMLVNADTGYLRDLSDRFDCAVMNMVLHHTPSPRQLFADVSRVLKVGAPLLVTELCRHNQTWVTQACGDIWLGFEPVDLTQWAEEADLIAGQSVFFALRNGFQIQIRQFFKSNSIQS
jgi:ubiquinone/menaquinone biosynthesis C-methylase UbiE/DNA-binding transcriptional ArsR family regulator